MKWPEKVSLARLPTLLHKLERFGVPDAPNIWLKRDDLTGFVCSGNKVRKLEFVLGEAVKQGVDRVVTCGGMQSNHCRATAFACAQLGLKAHLVLRDTGRQCTSGNYLLDQMAGADISLHPAKEYQARLSVLLESTAETYRDRGESVLIVPTGASDGLGVWGYAAAAFELLNDFEQCEISPRYVVCATGSGGTQAGLALGFAMAGADIEVIGIAVCDDELYFQQKVARDIADWQCRNPGLKLDAVPKYRTLDGYVGQGYAKPSDEELSVALEVARSEGVLLDPVYTGKAFRGLLCELRHKRFCDAEDIVFVHTGGGFGVFPFESDYRRLMSSAES